MFEVILGGAVVVGGVAIGVNKVINVGKSIRDNGLIETAIVEGKAVGRFAVKFKDHVIKEAERQANQQK